VYKNATPGALVKRIQGLVSDRRIKADEAQRLGGAYGVRFEIPGKRVSFSERPSTGEEGSEGMDRAKQLIEGILMRAGASISAANRDKLRSVATTIGDANGSLDSAIEALNAMIGEAEGEKKESDEARAALTRANTELGIDLTNPAAVANGKRMIAAGKQYRDGLIEEVIKTRTATLGGEIMNDDAIKTVRDHLSEMPIAMVEIEARSWQVRKSETFTRRPMGNNIPDPNPAPVDGDTASMFEESKRV
jgi:hypothetical protein